MEIKPAKRAGEIVGLLRGKAGMTQPDVASKAHCHPTTVSHLENGTKSVHIGTVKAVGAAIGYEDVVAKVWGFVDGPNFTDVVGTSAAYEKESTRLSIWTTYFVHTLLQTEAYSRAVLNAGLPFSSEAERRQGSPATTSAASRSGETTRRSCGRSSMRASCTGRTAVRTSCVSSWPT